MKKKIGGTKRSSWLTFRRRLLLVRLLLRSAASKDELIQGVHDEMGEEGYPSSPESALKHDFDALKTEYGCVIKFKRRIGRFILKDVGVLALLDLPDHCMEAFGLLQAYFPPHGDTPEHHHIRDFLDHVALLIPKHRQKAYFGEDTSFPPVSDEQTPVQVNTQVVSKIKRAIRQKKLVEFDYIGSSDDGKTHHHKVAPYDIVLDTKEQSYLDATLLEVSPNDTYMKHKNVSYHLHRIVADSIVIVSEQCPNERPEPPTYSLRYVLTPEFAKLPDVATYFLHTHIAYQEDGRAIVTATTTNLWQAHQILLRYGAACEVQEPPELIEMFRATVQGLSNMYQKNLLTL